MAAAPCEPPNTRICRKARVFGASFRRAANADRIARHTDFPGGKSSFAPLIGQKYPIDKFPQNAVRVSRQGVLLRNGGGTTRQIRGHDGGTRGISADAQNDIGPEIRENPPGLHHADRDRVNAFDQCLPTPSLQPFHVNELQFVSHLFQKPVFNAPAGSDKDHPVLSVAPLKLLRDGNAGKQMTARSSSRNDNPHRFSPACAPALLLFIFSPLRSSAWRCSAKSPRSSCS